MMYTEVIHPTLEELPGDEINEVSTDMSSYNHSYMQINLGASLKMLGAYTVFSELSLDVTGVDLSQFQVRAKEEIKPDLCLYPKRSLSRPVDILKMSEMPLLVVEILSPLQGSYEILQKFRLYFALGVKSCWLVDPATEVVVVYAGMEKHKTFSSGEVVDEVMAIRLPFDQIFE
ncbi:MAG: Uma2 family endonuclease [Caldilineaceae bacterium]|jgi:Uma2 family endonuclease